MTRQTSSERERLFLPFADEIDAFYRERFHYKSRCAHARFPTVDIHRTPVRLYLRFRPEGFWPRNSVVIASIGFRDRRRGHGRELLSKLVEMSDRFGFKMIGIEQTGRSESIQNFVRKFGFANHVNEQNWTVSVNALRASLVSLPPQPTQRNRKGVKLGQRLITARAASRKD